MLLNNEDYIFELTINGNVYTIDTKWLLNLKVGLTEDKSNQELEESLQLIAGYLHTFTAAYEELNKLKMKKELEYDVWYNESYYKYEKELTNRYGEEIRAGLRSKSNSEPKKSQIESLLITADKKTYMEKNEELINIRHNVEYLAKEIDIIKSRGTHLQTIIKTRRDNNIIDS